MRKKYYYVKKFEVDNFISRLSQWQSAKKCFENISVKPYYGKKYDPENTVCIVVG